MGPTSSDAAALQLLAELVADGRPVRMSYARGGWRARLVVEADGDTAPPLPAAPAPDPAAAAPRPVEIQPHWLFLSELEEKVVAAATDQWQTARELARRCDDWPFSSEFRCNLRNMANRNILESLHGRGWRLKPPPAHADDAGGRNP